MSLYVNTNKTEYTRFKQGLSPLKEAGLENYLSSSYTSVGVSYLLEGMSTYAKRKRGMILTG